MHIETGVKEALDFVWKLNANCHIGFHTCEACLICAEAVFGSWQFQ